MRVLFWGTPEFALPSLRALIGEGHEVVGVVTQPDRKAGRGRSLRASPVKDAALEERLPVLTPEHPRGTAFIDTLRALEPDVSVVVAYGHILALDVLELPAEGSLNVHASLLPALRGAAPIPWAVARGMDRTGVTIMRMSEGMDAGPILLQRDIPIVSDDTAAGLAIRLSELGAEALMEALALLGVGALRPVEQDHAMATYAPKIDREVARVDWSRPAREVADHIRAMDQVPGAWTQYGSAPLKLFQPSLDPAGQDVRGGASPGTVLAADPSTGLLVQTGSDAIALGEVQPAGKNRMSAAAWIRGGGPEAGTRFH